MKIYSLVHQVIFSAMTISIALLANNSITFAQNINNHTLQTKNELILAQTPEKTPKEIYQESKDGVVIIETGTGIGSGFIIRKSGFNCFPQEYLVITNAHVIENNFFVTVTLANGNEYSGYVVKTDEQTDLAAISFESPFASILNPSKPLLFLHTLSFSWISNSYEVGDPVYAISSPEGIPNAFTQGMISGIDSQRGMIHDAVTYHGSSGSPLLNSQGQVIGVNYGGTESGLNLAIPLEKVEAFVNPLVETKWCPPFKFNPGLLNP